MTQRPRAWLFWPMFAAAAVICAPAFAQQADSSGQGSIGYRTVIGALIALRSKPDVRISSQGGWTIIEDREDNSVWSFTPAGHPAHPAAVKRTVVEKDGVLSIETNALCQARKAECDKLIAEFKALNEKIRSKFGK